MITQEQQKQGQELLNTLIQKALENPEFKSQLVTNPKETMATHLGKDFSKLNSDKELVVEDQSDDSIIYLNLPINFNEMDFELSEEELLIVSGGESGTSDCNGWNPVKWAGYNLHMFVDWVKEQFD